MRKTHRQHRTATAFQAAFVLLLSGILAVAAPPEIQAAQVCSLINPAEAAAILDEPVKPGRSGRVVGFAAGHSCTYVTAAPLAERGGTGVVSLIVHDGVTMAQEQSVYTSPRSYFEKVLQTHQKFGPQAIQPVEGLGDSAFWQAGSDRLHLLVGETYYILSVNDLVKLTSELGREDLEQKLSAHRLQKSVQAVRDYLLPDIDR